MLNELVARFLYLIAAPFENLGDAWPILPVYAALLAGELYDKKGSFVHAVANGVVMLWAGLYWALFLGKISFTKYIFSSMKWPWIVTACIIGLGLFSVILGVRRKDKALCAILGRTRFSSYFIILFFPMQIGPAHWDWTSVSAILVFALPFWLIVYLLGRLGKLFI